MVERYKSVIDFINTNKKWSMTTKGNYLQGLASVTRNLDGFQKEYKTYSNLSTQVYEQYVLPQTRLNRLTPEKKKNYVKWADFLQNMEDDVFDKGSKQEAIVSLYIWIYHQGD